MKGQSLLTTFLKIRTVRINLTRAHKRDFQMKWLAASAAQSECGQI